MSRLMCECSYGANEWWLLWMFNPRNHHSPSRSLQERYIHICIYIYMCMLMQNKFIHICMYIYVDIYMYFNCVNEWFLWMFNTGNNHSLLEAWEKGIYMYLFIYICIYICNISNINDFSNNNDNNSNYLYIGTPPKMGKWGSLPMNGQVSCEGPKGKTSLKEAAPGPGAFFR